MKYHLSKMMENIIKLINKKIESFLLKQENPTTLIYFIVYVYTYYMNGPQSTDFMLIAYIVGIFSIIISNYNFLYMIGGAFSNHIPIVVIMIIINILSCTQKAKIYLFLHSLGNQLLSHTIFYNYFSIFFPILIIFQIYNNLIFKQKKENIEYFIGMSTLSSFFTIKIIEISFDFTIAIPIVIILLFAVILVSKLIIEQRINIINNMNPLQIKNNSIMAHYLKLGQDNIEDNFLIFIRLQYHEKLCIYANCFCNQNYQQNRYINLLRHLYEKSIKNIKNNEIILFEFYINFLLNNNLLINAIYFLNSWKIQNYLELISFIRCQSKIKYIMKCLDSSNIYNYQYEYALQYDQYSRQIVIQINDIIKMKLQFWEELIKQSSKILKIQKVGHQIIDKMYRLNIFYNKVIKKYQKNIFLFESTALYAMYVLSTTNFKQYAELIIKNTAKLLQQVYITQSSASQTYSIRTIVKRQDKNYIKNNQLLSILKSEQNEQNEFKLIIDSVNIGFCKLLQVQKSELIGKQLNFMIPIGYKQVHNVRLRYLLDFNNQFPGQIIPSKVLHKQLKLPIRGKNGKLLIGYVCIKNHLDFNEGLTFISIIKLSHDKYHSALLNFDGKITQIQSGFNQQLLIHSQIQKYIFKCRNSWRQNKIINSQNFNIIINSTNYGITISSPLLGLFLQKQNLKQKQPPIHIQIINEDINRIRTAQNDKNNKIGFQIKQMQNAIYAYDTQSSKSTSKGGSFAVNILSNFSQANYNPLYRYLQIIFIAIIISCILSNLGAYLVADLPWDSTKPYQNPLNDTMNFYALQMLTIKSLLVLGDQQLYFSQNNLNQSRISQYFGFDNYQASVINLTNQIQRAYKSSIHNLMTPSSVLTQVINNKLQTPLNLSNPVDFKNILINQTYQVVTYLQLLMIYATDLSLMSRLQLYTPVIGYSFSIQISQIQNITQFTNTISNSIHDAQRISIAVHIALMVFTSLLIIPLCCILRQRVSLHLKIFDLLVSIDSEQIQDEMKSLQYINNILRNYKESNEIMKMNVLGYRQHILNPKRQKRNSLQNEMVIGLQRYDNSNQEKQYSYISGNISSQKLDNIKQGDKSKQIFNLIKRRNMNLKNNKKIQKRKRSGQLDLTNSIYDPQRKIIYTHYGLYIISLSFIIIIGISLNFNLQFNDNYIKAKNLLLNTYQKQVIFQQYFLTSKVMLQQGSQFFATFFGAPNALALVYSMLQAFPAYDYSDSSHMFSDILPACGDMSDKIYKKYCQYNYSQVILIGEFGGIYKNLMQYRYNLDHNTGNLSKLNTTLSILQKIFYLQSLNLQLQKLLLQKINYIFDQIMKESMYYYNIKLYLLGMVVFLGLIGCVIGYRLILQMKQRYFKEVFMITFLNNEMINKNKRVQSFLQLIAKNITS